METNVLELFNVLYKKYYKVINGYFSKRFDKNESEDLTQQTFMKLWAYLPAINGIENERALIFSVAKSVLYDRLRQKAVNAAYRINDLTNVADYNNICEEIEWSLLLDTLPEEDREIFEMYLYGFKSREIGSYFGISASATRSRISKIKTHLKRKLK